MDSLFKKKTLDIVNYYGLVESVQVTIHGGIGIDLVMARPSVLYHAVTSAGDGLVFILLPVRWIGRLVHIDTDPYPYQSSFGLITQII